MPVDQIKDIVDYGVIGLLLFLSFVTFMFAIERALFYRSIKVEDYSHKNALELDLTKRLPTIASIGSNAPYIG
ncbi:MAG: TonB-system energizer ExbB, partial [Sulfurovum sp.]